MTAEFTTAQLNALRIEAEAHYFAPYYDEAVEESYDWNASDTYYDCDDYEYQQGLYA